MALVFRAYYALIRSPRITSDGRNTNAQFGFTNALIDLIKNQQPTHIAVCFDTHAPTERHTDFADYKANRQETPEDILDSIPEIKEIIKGFNIPVVELDGYEADDVIGTLAKQAEKEGFDVYMVTPDKDYGQLVSDKIKIYKPPYQGGAYEILGPAEVCKKWDIERVDQVIEILGLMGDAVDNIPGIPGVGEKTAAKLLKEYGTIEQILENADQIKGALGEKVRNGKEMALMSKKLATIITNVPVQFHEEAFALKAHNKEALSNIFSHLEFKTLGKRILGEDIPATAPASNQQNENAQMDLFGNPVTVEKASATREDDAPVLIPDKNIDNTPHQYHLTQSAAAIKTLIKNLEREKEICFDTETTNIDANLAELVGMSFSFTPSEAYYVPCPADKKQCLALLEWFKPLFNDEKKLWIGQNLKYDLLVLKWYGFELKGKIFDTMLAHYVIEPEGKRNMDALSAKYLGYEPIHI